MNKSDIRNLVEYWSKIIGVSPCHVRLVGMKRKWASVSEKGVLVLNKVLLDLPRELVEYIVVHELIHLKTKAVTHNRLFKVTLSSYMPDWKVREEKLRKIGNSAEL